MKTKYPIERFVDKIDDLSMIPEKIADGIRKTIEDFAVRLENLEEAKASQKSQPDKWSRKEILGHLIDSAANNHQRFVRVQYLKDLNLPPYDQIEWVKIQQYSLRTWKELLTLWKSYNFHLAHIIKHMPTDCLRIQITIGSGEPVTIGYVVEDYLGHMQHHLRQIEQM
ncbi:MAG: DinB family protein [Bacteroidota bacterium]|jgi:hypothetical protein